MIGAIIGDICGSVYEFRNCKEYDKIELFKDGCCVTDDSVMTVAVAAALMDADEQCEREPFDSWLACFEELVVKYMRYYGAMYPDAGYGGRFFNWLFTPDPHPYYSFGNGSAMRVSSVGWAFDSLEMTLAAAESSTRVTHNHPEGIKGAKAVAGAIYMARTGGSKEDIRKFVEGLGYDLNFTVDGIRPSYRHDESCQNSVPQAIRCFLESTDFEQCIRLTLSLGGDCDTTAAMSGAIAEAYYGAHDADSPAAGSGANIDTRCGIPSWMMHRALGIIPEPLLAQYTRFISRYQPERLTRA